jgi:hypothetical protein
VLATGVHEWFPPQAILQYEFEHFKYSVN